MNSKSIDIINNFAKRYATYCSSFPCFFESEGGWSIQKKFENETNMPNIYWRKAFVKLLEIPDIY